MQSIQTFLLVSLSLGAVLAAQSHVVVPAAHANTDAMSYEWIAGASQPLRQQTLIGQSHLQVMQNQQIQAIELRRTAANEIYQGGSMTLSVSLSTSPNTPLGCSNQWAPNIGLDAILVFNGTVQLPTSPATPAGTGTPVAWTTNNTLRISFQQPFLYTGGTLCVDVIGQPITGQEANWWMADATEEVIAGGAIVEIGAGCGSYGGPQHQWSQVAARSLVPGGRAQFRAEGIAGGFAMAAFGAPAALPIPLTLFGVNSPGCSSHLDPAMILAVVPTTYVAEVHPLSSVSAIAEVLVQLPSHPSWFGMQLSTQWFDLTQLTTSNAFTWTVANSIPTLDMALNEGHPTEATGHVTTYLAHVMRFEYQ